MQDEYALWDGDYVKETYLAMIDGEEVACWPNAGKMVSCDGSGREWSAEDNIQVRICTHEEHYEAAKNAPHKSEVMDEDRRPLGTFLFMPLVNPETPYCLAKGPQRYGSMAPMPSKRKKLKGYQKLY